MTKPKFEFDVALSFAGEEREFVRSVADCLQKKGVSSFYDEYLEDHLWGKDLYQHLDDVYQNKADYCVIFISKNYAEKLWTTHELKSAQERAFKENREYILPIRFDDTTLPGLRSTVGYIDARKKNPEEICELIIKKINKKFTEETKEIDEDTISIPRIRKEITDIEKNKLLKETFQEIGSYFQKGLKILKNKYTKEVDYDYNEISNSKFTAAIFVDGDLKSICKIWIGSGIFSGGSISYLENTRDIDITNDNSLNESVTIEEDGNEIYFRALMSFGASQEGINPYKMKKEEVSKYLWSKFTGNLTR